ncbi:MAG: hypothetical protein FJW31_08415 [Acidobacteria bacterium]|nr:hypothetical protein [Acidobacteriota bacterium]
MRSALIVLSLLLGAAVNTQAGSSSVRAFSRVYRALQHPRCMNCHPAGNRPLHGNDSHPYSFHERETREKRFPQSSSTAGCGKALP